MCKKMLLTLIISISPVFLGACSHVAGNVVPDNGPTMENIYDDLGDTPASAKPDAMVFMGDQHSSMNAGKVALSSGSALLVGVESPTFSLLDNPQLKVYVFPHLTGSEMLPIPGYWTAFSAYSRSYYALPLAADLGTSTPKNHSEVQS
jgi:conjugative transfer region lipoprotein (TIGR03751 family)